jgi:galacturan 1,4-alpha-galacturonidase
MRFQFSTLLAVASATLTIATPTLHAERAQPEGQENDRPSVNCSPYQPRVKPFHPRRGRVCYVKSNNDGTDDSPAILKAVADCNNGGRVIFRQQNNYTIGTALDLTHLEHIDIGNQVTKSYTQ